MSSQDKVIITRPLGKANMELDVWSEDTIKAFPITEEHIGKFVKYASSPRERGFKLKEIKDVGDFQFPDGGYILSNPGTDYPLHVFFDEIIPWVNKKKEPKPATSQLSRKKKKTKTKTKKS